MPPLLVGDPGRLRQIIINLLGNAIKFTEHGEVFVDVRARRRTAADKVRLHCAVADTGIGIPPDKLHRIFESFSQADRSTTRRFGGSGLGLAISAKLVNMMGGRIWVESEVGRGSTFHFEAEFGPRRGAHGREAGRPPANSATCLSCWSTTIPAQPARLRGTVDAAWNAGRGLLATRPMPWRKLIAPPIAGAPFRLAIIDADMPGPDGWTLAEMLRGDGAMPIARSLSWCRPARREFRPNIATCRPCSSSRSRPSTPN